MESHEELEARMRKEFPMYDEAKRVMRRLTLAGDDGSWAGETDKVRVHILQTAVIAQELQHVKDGKV